MATDVWMQKEWLGERGAAIGRHLCKKFIHFISSELNIPAVSGIKTKVRCRRRQLSAESRAPNFSGFRFAQDQIFIERVSTAEQLLPSLPSPGAVLNGTAPLDESGIGGCQNRSWLTALCQV